MPFSFSSIYELLTNKFLAQFPKFVGLDGTRGPWLERINIGICDSTFYQISTILIRDAGIEGSKRVRRGADLYRNDIKLALKAFLVAQESICGD